MRQLRILSLLRSLLYKLAGILFIFLVLNSCSKEKDAFINRSFHSTTTRYNYYFNAYEAYKAGMKKLEELHQDDFNEILKVFPYGGADDAQSVFPDMDKAIQKLSIAALKHSMFIADRERNSWMDESYLLMGKAQLAKRDYIAAKSSFEFIISRFDKLPTKYDAMVHQARLYIMKEQYEKAEPLLGIVSGAVKKGITNKEAKVMYPMVYADFHLQQKNYAAAIPFLRQAIKVNPSKKARYRMSYILAQVLYVENNYEEAGKAFNKVIRMNPPYSYAFNARINMARCYDAENGGSARGIVKLLEKMLKDEKNKEYLDQVYYALAEISLKQQDTVQAIEYLRQSAASSMQNRNQKALSCLKLADLYFLEPDYKNSQAYYDSTMQFLNKEYPDYEGISKKTTVLNELVGHLLIIENEDSLQRIAAMSENDRNALIDGIIKEILEQEEIKRQEEMERQKSIQFYEEENRKPSSVTQSQGFYFYSSQALSMGFTEFQKRWNGRPLEDMWRLSDKKGGNFSGDMAEGQDSTAVDSLAGPVGNPKDRNYYLSQLPLTPELLIISNHKIAKALLGAGHVYRTGLNDPDQAISSFLTFEKRFPGDSMEVQAWFQLYNIYKEVEFIEMAERYKQKIIKGYPDTDYARLLIDPEYYAKLEARKNEGENFYSSTYEAFINGDHDKVVRNKAIAFAKYGDKDLLARFDYLKLLSANRDIAQDSLRPILVTFAGKYPDTRAEKHARALIASIDEKNKPLETATDTSETGEPVISGIYEFDKSLPHLLVIVVDGNKANINELKVMVSDHNLTYYSLKKLSITSVLLDTDRQLITVSSFKNQKEVMEYLKGLNKDEKLAGVISEGDGEIFAINTPNYAKFYKRKNTTEYMSFFKSFYKD